MPHLLIFIYLVVVVVVVVVVVAVVVVVVVVMFCRGIRSMSVNFGKIVKIVKGM